MLREAVNLSPDTKLRPSYAAIDSSTDSDMDTDALAALPHCCDLAPPESAGNNEEQWQQQGQQQGKGQGQQQGHEGPNAGRGAATLREAYKEMLLQQQSRHSSELERIQAKHQQHLDTQVMLHALKLLHGSDCPHLVHQGLCMHSRSGSGHGKSLVYRLLVLQSIAGYALHMLATTCM